MPSVYGGIGDGASPSYIKRGMKKSISVSAVHGNKAAADFCKIIITGFKLER